LQHGCLKRAQIPNQSADPTEDRKEGGTGHFAEFGGPNPSSLLHLWIFAPSVPQKSLLSCVLQTFGSTEFAGQKIA
jgi:hypothetical protein